MAGGRVDGEGREGEGIEPWHRGAQRSILIVRGLVISIFGWLLSVTLRCFWYLIKFVLCSPVYICRTHTVHIRVLGCSTGGSLFATARSSIAL